jgi:hypothetical protein
MRVYAGIEERWRFSSILMWPNIARQDILGLGPIYKRE